MAKRSIIITGDSREVDKISRENSRRVNIGLITIREVNATSEDTDTKGNDTKKQRTIHVPKVKVVQEDTKVIEVPETPEEVIEPEKQEEVI